MSLDDAHLLERAGQLTLQVLLPSFERLDRLDGKFRIAGGALRSEDLASSRAGAESVDLCRMLEPVHDRGTTGIAAEHKRTAETRRRAERFDQRCHLHGVGGRSLKGVGVMRSRIDRHLAGAFFHLIEGQRNGFRHRMVLVKK